ncbi:MAG TPA: hypothetical protein P5026_04455 [Kiritimatiellia bacterium]|nr:hypothetical protein [Kiritimatiellia bacterium]HRU70315.1 hypothetical protein [Kiritimatiellia bacterium]
MNKAPTRRWRRRKKDLAQCALLNKLLEREGDLLLRVRFAIEVDPEHDVDDQIAELREVKARCDGYSTKV